VKLFLREPLGLGYSFNDFEKGRGITDLEDDLEGSLEYSGYDVDISCDPDIEDSFALALGFGWDYFFNKNFALTIIDMRFLVTDADNEWTVKVAGEGYEGEDSWTDELHLSNWQLLVGLKYWF
jgi:hypothetical protein